MIPSANSPTHVLSTVQNDLVAPHIRTNRLERLNNVSAHVLPPVVWVAHDVFNVAHQSGFVDEFAFNHDGSGGCDPLFAEVFDDDGEVFVVVAAEVLEAV